jgi:hypothetical protein
MASDPMLPATIITNNDFGLEATPCIDPSKYGIVRMSVFPLNVHP